MPVDAEVLDYSALHPGVTYNRGVRLSPVLVAWLNRLRSIVPADIPIHVTSGIRTAEEQASAMWAKYQAAEAKRPGSGPAELDRTYRADIRPFLAAPPSEWAGIVDDARKRGILYSRHLTGDGLDLRNRIYSGSDAATVEAAIRATGARLLPEGTPPHYHVDGIAASLAKPAPSPIARIAGAGGGVGVLVLPFALAAVAAAFDTWR